MRRWLRENENSFHRERKRMYGGNFIDLSEMSYQMAYEWLVADAHQRGYRPDEVYWSIENNFLMYRTPELMDELLEYELENLSL